MEKTSRPWLRWVLATILLFPGCGRVGSGGSPQHSNGVAGTFRISVESTGAQSNSWSDGPSVSSDGRYIAFESPADNLVAGDTNDCLDVFVRDTVAGTTAVVSVSSSGAPGNDYSHSPSISADGRFVAFSSRATNLSPGDSNGQEDVFVRDLLAGTTVRVSVDSAGIEADHFSHHPSISADGRYVAFESVATNLVAGDTNSAADIFVRDLVAATTIRVSVDSAGAQGDYASGQPAISSDGRYVVFESVADNLVAGDSNDSMDIFRHDTVTGRTDRVSLKMQDSESNGPCRSASISSDGRYVAFESLADNLVPFDANQELDVFIRDMVERTTARVSVGMQDVESNGPCRSASISSDGRSVAFWSTASNLVAEDTNGWSDIFVRDLNRGTTIRVSVDSSGAQGNSDSHSPALDSEGRFVAFTSNSSGLVTNDTNGESDVFVRGPLK